MDHQEDEIDPRMKLRPNTGDKLHALQLLRNLEIINESTQRELWPLPAAGLPVQVKRKPHLPIRAPEAQPASIDNDDLIVELAAAQPVEHHLTTESDMQNHLHSLGFGLMLTLAACSSSNSVGGGSGVDFKLNPKPKIGYQFTMTLANAPGPFAWVQGFVQYDVVNPECLPPPDSNVGGYEPHMTRRITFLLIRVSEVEYTGTVYADAILDEDYYGRGICHWQLTEAKAHMKATGVPGETLFSAGLFTESVFAEKTETSYFLKASYPRHPQSTLENPLASGATDRSRMASYLVDEDLFTITMASKRISP